MIPKKIGRYEILSAIGRGGMGVVYLARDPQIDRQVAIKLLSNQHLFNKKIRERFQREARIIARLDHPSIVPIYDVGEFDNQPFIVMRYMAGGSLSEWISQGKLPLDTAVIIIKRLASALAEAHQAGIIHRDLKPSNILLDNRGEAYLSDFGIVKVSDATTSLTGSSIIGTPAYMSPEQGSNTAKLDHRTDIYSFGAILFEMLTGKRPFLGDSILEQIIAHATKPIPNVREIEQTLPIGIEHVIEKAMAKKPEDRFSSIIQMVEEIDSVISTADLQLPEFTAPTAPVTQSARRSGAYWLWGVGGLGLLLLFMTFGSQYFMPIAQATATETATNTPLPTNTSTPTNTSMPTNTAEAISVIGEETAVSTPTPQPTTTPIPSLAPVFHIVSLENSSILAEPESNLGLGAGQTTLHGIPFEHGWKVSTTCALNSEGRQARYDFSAEGLTAVKLHLLLQAGQGLITFSDQKIGELIVVFENGLSFAEPLILGQNIRDWRSALPEQYVNRVTSSHIEEAWRGKAGNIDGRIDHLTLTLPHASQNEPIQTIQLVDSSLGLVGNNDPCIHLLALTIESNPE